MIDKPCDERDSLAKEENPPLPPNLPLNLKKIKALKILIISFIIMVGALILMITAQFHAVNYNGFTGDVYKIEASLPLKRYLRIEVGNIPLRVEAYAGEEIKVSYINETDLIIEESGYELVIKQDPDFSFSLFTRDILNYRLEVLLPDKVYNSVIIGTTSGNVDLGYLYAKELHVNGRSGKINISDTGGKIFIDSKNGDVNISFLDLTDTVAINTESGNVNVLMPDNESPRLSFVTESGSFTGDFFRFEYNNYYGDVFMEQGKNPKAFHVGTKSGNLTFLKRLLYEDF